MTDSPERIRRAVERRRHARSEHRIVTVPNVISLFRLAVLMPFFVVVLLVWRSPGWALLVAVVLGATDFVDGYIARRFNQVTVLGRALDPIADRISQIVVSATLVVGGYLPVWMAVTVVACDLVLGTTLLARGRGAIPVRWIGRIRTALLMLGLPLVLLVAAVAPMNAPLRIIVLVVVGAGVVLHAVADLTYAWTVLRNSADDVRDAHPTPAASNRPGRT
jgi:cardiolipin synthase